MARGWLRRDPTPLAPPNTRAATDLDILEGNSGQANRLLTFVHCPTGARSTSHPPSFATTAIVAITSFAAAIAATVAAAPAVVTNVAVTTAAAVTTASADDTVVVERDWSRLGGGRSEW